MEKSTLEEYQDSSSDTRDTPRAELGGHEAHKEDGLSLSPAEKARSIKTLTKIDLHIMPPIIMVYICAFLDRANIANALLFKLPEDLNLTGLQPNIAICIFLVAYVAFEIPMTMLMKRLSPHLFLSGCMFLFGLLVVVQGLVKNYAGLLVTRFLMGSLEAGVYPGCYYLMSMWYSRIEAQKRFSFFFAGASFAGAFGGLLAGAIGHMDGLRGYSAWRWIFILEGTMTCVLAIVAFFTVSDFPEDANWLTPEEKLARVEWLAAEQGPTGFESSVAPKDIIKVLSDWKVLLAAPLYLSVTVPVNGLGYFIPSIVKTYGYSPIQSQLHSVAPWSAALVSCLFVAFASDRARKRYVFLAGSMLLCLVGNVMLLLIHTNRGAEYAGVFLMLMGCVSATPIAICWVAMNLRGHKERAIGIPWQVGFGNASGIIAVFAFPLKDAPQYHLGYALCLGFTCLAIAIATVYYVRCIFLNKKLGHGRYVL